MRPLKRGTSASWPRPSTGMRIAVPDAAQSVARLLTSCIRASTCAYRRVKSAWRALRSGRAVHSFKPEFSRCTRINSQGSVRTTFSSRSPCGAHCLRRCRAACTAHSEEGRSSAGPVSEPLLAIGAPHLAAALHALGRRRLRHLASSIARATRATRMPPVCAIGSTRH